MTLEDLQSQPSEDENENESQSESESKPQSNLSRYAELRLAEIEDNLEAAQIYRELINGKPINEIARDMKISNRTVEQKLKIVSRWTAQDAAIQAETWLSVSMSRFEAAIMVIMRKIRAYQDADNGDDDDDKKIVEIDFRVFDKLESLIKAQASIRAQIYGRKDLPSNVTNNLFAPTMTAGSKLHKISIVREQESHASEVMPQLLPFKIESRPELDLIDDRRGIGNDEFDFGDEE